jgi:hypothetical protein
MAIPLKKIDLLLNEDLIERLKEEAAQRCVSPSEVVNSLLSRDLGLTESATGATERLRRLREKIGPMPESTGAIRSSRERGW